MALARKHRRDSRKGSVSSLRIGTMEVINRPLQRVKFFTSRYHQYPPVYRRRSRLVYFQTPGQSSESTNGDIISDSSRLFGSSDGSDSGSDHIPAVPTGPMPGVEQVEVQPQDVEEMELDEPEAREFNQFRHPMFMLITSLQISD